MEEQEQTDGWSIELGVYPGILFGIRTYNYGNSQQHTLYLPFIYIAVEIFKGKE